MLLEINVKTWARFLLRVQRLIEISEVEITTVDCILFDFTEHIKNRNTRANLPKRPYLFRSVFLHGQEIVIPKGLLKVALMNV